MGYARSPTHIFPSVSVGEQLGVVYAYVCVCVRAAHVHAAMSVRKPEENAMYGAAEVLGDSASNNGRVRD